MIISKDTTFYLYGYTYSAKEAYEALAEAGYSVRGYIDRNAQLYRDKCKIPMYSVEELEDLEKTNVVVIILLRNVVSHEEVAKFLASKGFVYILYLPSAMNLVAQHENALRTIYNLLSAGYASDIVGKNIPPYNECFFYSNDARKCFVSETVNTMVVRCPWTLAYCPTLEWRRDNEHVKRGIDKIWDENDIPIVAQRLYAGLIEYHGNLLDETDGINFYIQHRKTQMSYAEETSSAKELKNRILILDMMEEKFNEGLEYYENAPAEAVWNSKGYFNIVDGAHRCHFLMSKGMKYVPIRISKKDYERWYNASVLEKCISYIEEHRIVKSRVHIPHPAFSAFSSEMEWKRKTILEYIFRWIYLRDLSGKRMLEISDYNSYFARNLYRRGVGLAVSYEPNDDGREFARLLNELLYTQDVMLVSDMETVEIEGKYQITCIINPDEKYVSQKMIIDTINKYSEGIIFWQSRTEKFLEEKADILTKTAFKYYRCIFNGYNGKCMSEFGIFSTNPEFEY